MGKEAHDKDWRDDPLENTTPVRGSGNFLKDRGYSDSTWKMRSHNIVQIQASVGLGSLRRFAIRFLANLVGIRRRRVDDQRS